MQQTYQNLASIYDQLQQGISLSEWADFIQKLEKTFSYRLGQGDGVDGKPILLDLGCGTGSFCLEMSRRGYDTIGIDASAMMLDQARRKCTDAMTGVSAKLTPLFLQQDISSFELYGTVDLIVCLLDTINHLTRQNQVSRLFKLCANYLNPGGLFIFDLATEKHLSVTLGNQQFFQDHEEFTLLWQNSYRTKTEISRSELAFFVKTEDGTYLRYDETIVEKCYKPASIRQWAADAGLELVGHFGDLSMKKPNKNEERHFYIVRKPISHSNQTEDVKP